jgi:hypothetical protein
MYVHIYVILYVHRYMQTDGKPNGDPGEGRIFISNFIYAWISCLYHFINGESDKYVPKHNCKLVCKPH